MITSVKSDLATSQAEIFFRCTTLASFVDLSLMINKHLPP